MSKQLVTAVAPIAVNSADMAALVKLLEKVTGELTSLKSAVVTIKADQMAANRAIVAQRHGDKVAAQVGDSAAILRQLVAAPVTNASDQWSDYSLPTEVRP